LVVSRDLDSRVAHARDASGLEMIPEAVARVETVGDIVEVVRLASILESSVTPAGSQTSMTGASITDRGILVSLAGMKRVLDVDVARRLARVEPGVTIGQLNRELAADNLMFAPDPTSEQDATIGGAIACNASGARSLYYGATRRHVNAVSVVHADGEIAEYRRSRPEKNTVGFAAAQDPVDWFVGSEGTLGIVAEAELSLVPVPAHVVGVAIPFRDQASALQFVVAARDGESGRNARCLEFFDETASDIAAKSVSSSWGDSAAMIYLEDDAGDASDLSDVMSAWLETAERFAALSDDIRIFDGAQALREARLMRHAVPATMNERGAAQIRNGGRKVSTDWAVPYARLSEALDASKTAVERNGASAPVTYGHAGNGHPHQNFIAHSAEELRVINASIEETLKCVIHMGGTVSAEHGLGKLKQAWLGLQLSPRQIAIMRAMKQTLDPSGIFSPGNVL
jgi:glycolate oxidase